ncbi:MAG: DivIVA domain-containing protein [Nocardioidaceae bacterium]
MPLTPEDVHKKTFTPVRLREGYDMGEVDQFLDEVETELVRLQQDNEELRARLETVSTSVPAPDSAMPAAVVQPEAEAEPSAEPPAVPVVRTVPEASSAAARLLEIATNNADQLLNEAKDEADKIIGEARTKAERLESESKSTSERLESDARTRAEMLDSEISERRHQLFGELERDKESMTRELDDLRSFEREYRSRLKGYFEAQLKALDDDADAGVPLSPSRDEETPRRLRELLGEET